MQYGEIPYVDKPVSRLFYGTASMPFVAGGDGGGIGNGPRLGAADGGLYFTLKKSIQIHDSSKWRETICLPLFKKRSNPLRALPCRFPRAKKVRLLFSHFTPAFFSYG